MDLRYESARLFVLNVPLCFFCFAFAYVQASKAVALAAADRTSGSSEDGSLVFRRCNIFCIGLHFVCPDDSAGAPGRPSVTYDNFCFPNKTLYLRTHRHLPLLNRPKHPRSKRLTNTIVAILIKWNHSQPPLCRASRRQLQSLQSPKIRAPNPMKSRQKRHHQIRHVVLRRDSCCYYYCCYCSYSCHYCYVEPAGCSCNPCKAQRFELRIR
jgi:hypothetical protein